MRLSRVFAESFLDGFTMSGFMTRLRQPGSATGIVAPEPGLRVTFGTAPSHADDFVVSGELSSVPQSALRAMMTLLKKEEERRAAHDTSDKALHGASQIGTSYPLHPN